MTKTVGIGELRSRPDRRLKGKCRVPILSARNNSYSRTPFESSRLTPTTNENSIQRAAEVMLASIVYITMALSPNLLFERKGLPNLPTKCLSDVNKYGNAINRPLISVARLDPDGNLANSSFRNVSCAKPRTIGIHLAEPNKVNSYQNNGLEPPALPSGG